MMNPLTSMFKSCLSLAVIMRFEQLNESVWAMTYLIVDEATSEAAWSTLCTTLCNSTLTF